MICISYKADGSLDVDSVLIRLTTENGLALGHNGNIYVALKEDKKESGYEGKDIIEMDPKKIKKRKELKLKYSDNPGKRLSDESPDLQAFIDSTSHVRLSDVCKIKIKNNSLKPKVKKKIKKAIKQLLETKYI